MPGHPLGFIAFGGWVWGCRTCASTCREMVDRFLSNLLLKDLLKRLNLPLLRRGIRRLFTFSMSEPFQNQPNPRSDPQANPPGDPFASTSASSPFASQQGQRNATGPMSPEEQEAAKFANEAANGVDALNDPLTAALAELATLKAKSADLADQYLRAKAEAENARRRAEDEISKARKFAVESFAESLLPVADSLESGLAIKDATVEQIHEGEAPDHLRQGVAPNHLRQGVEATLRQLTAALERNKVMAINPEAGARFDPHHHQAISVVPSELEANTVVMVLQKGYSIADRILRPALVTVSAPK